jgi:hypothetical protein
MQFQRNRAPTPSYVPISSKIFVFNALMSIGFTMNAETLEVFLLI